MTHLVLIILAVIWAAVLLPPFLQNRSENRPADSISTFRSQLNVLERRSVGVGQPRPLDAPRSVRPLASAPGYSVAARSAVDRSRQARMAAKKRRRDILVTLLAAAGLTLVVSVVVPKVLLLHLLIDALLAAYVFLLVRQRKLAEERSMKVRYMAQAQAHRRAAAGPARRPVPAHLDLRPAAAN